MYNGSHYRQPYHLLAIGRRQAILINREGQECHDDEGREGLKTCYERGFEGKMGCKLPWTEDERGGLEVTLWPCEYNASDGLF